MRTATIILISLIAATAATAEPTVNVNIANTAELTQIMCAEDAGRVAAYRRHIGGFTNCEQLRSVLSVSCDGVRFVGQAVSR